MGLQEMKFCDSQRQMTIKDIGNESPYSLAKKSTSLCRGEVGTTLVVKNIAIIGARCESKIDQLANLHSDERRDLDPLP